MILQSTLAFPRPPPTKVLKRVGNCVNVENNEWTGRFYRNGTKIGRTGPFKVVKPVFDGIDPKGDPPLGRQDPY